MTEQRTEIVLLLNKILHQLNEVTASNYCDAVSETFVEIGLLFDVERIYMYEFDEDSTLMKINSQWNKITVEPKRYYAEDELVYEKPWLIRTLKEKEYVYIRDIQELPEDALMESLDFQEESINSILCAPIIIEGELCGFIGFENLTKTLNLQENDIKDLIEVTRAISAAKNKLEIIDNYEKIITSQKIILDNSDAHLWALKNVTKYGAVNLTHANFFGKKVKQMENQDIYDIFPKEIADKWVNYNSELFLAQGKKEIEVEFKNSAGKNRLLQVRATHQLDELGKIEYIVCTAKDITEQKAAEKALLKAKKAAEEANRMKSQFLANMSHEIRTPMNAIIGLTDVLEEEVIKPHNREYVKIIKRNGQHLLYIINDILDLSKIESGKIEAKLEEVNVWQLLQEMVKLFENQARQKKIKIKLSTQQKEPTRLLVVTDADKLKQILINLVGNAIKFTQKGYVEIVLEALNDKTINIHVIDTGIGISENNLEKIFDSFEQADKGTSKTYGGSGLGLTISRELARLLGGDIVAKSEINKGSQFTLMLIGNVKKGKLATLSVEVKNNPSQSDHPKQTVNKVQVKAGNQQKVKILLVDDNIDNRELVKVYLKKSNVVIDEADNGQKAIEMYIDNNDYDLILMDIQMPVLDGLAATRIIRLYEAEKKIKRTFIAALTAYAMEEDKNNCLEAGFDLHIAKPVKKREITELAQKIR